MSQSRGARWSLYQLPEGWIELGHAARKAVGLPRINLQLEAAKFIDYWTAATGKNAAKLDWLATWRNWCRNAYNAQPEAEPAGSVPLPANTDMEAARRRVALAAKGIRVGNLSKQDVQLGIAEGLISIERARALVRL